MASKISASAERKPTFIKAWRLHRGLTQQEVADRLGTSKQSISRIEGGQQTYTQESLEGLATILDCSPADLISRDPNDEFDLGSLFDLPFGDKERVMNFAKALKESALGGQKATVDYPAADRKNKRKIGDEPRRRP